MDQLTPLGTAISDIVPKTFSIYAPLLVANADAIRSTKRETFSYGPHPRQELDVYYPSKADIKSAPIFVFLYGGGLVHGDKTLPFAGGLAHANVGHFLAENLGCVAVIADYRLISHGAVYPSGGEDLSLVVDYVAKNLVDARAGGPRDLWLMGNSAGGIHLSTYLFSPVFEKARSVVMSKGSATGLVLRGAVMLSVPFHFRSALPARAEILKTYYGDQVDKHCPLGLLEGLEGTEVLPGVSILVLNGTLDPEDEILEPRDDFVKTWKSLASGGSEESLTVEMMEGQNHISPPLSLGTNDPKEEAWGNQVGRWMDSVRSRELSPLNKVQT